MKNLCHVWPFGQEHPLKEMVFLTYIFYWVKVAEWYTDTQIRYVLAKIFDLSSIRRHWQGARLPVKHGVLFLRDQLH